MYNSQLNLCASKVYVFSEEIIYATFEPSTRSLNEQDILEVVINGVRIENKTIVVIRGDVGKMQSKLSIERQVYTLNQTAIGKLTITNLGDTDVFVPIGLLSTVDIFSSHLDPIDPKYLIVKINNQPYASYPFDNFIAFNDEGLGGVIQPRSTIYVRFEIRPSEPNLLGTYKLYFHSFDTDNLLFNFLSSKIDNFKIHGASERSWSILSKAFLAAIASPQAQHKFLYDTVNELSAHNIKVYRLDDLIAYHINRFNHAFQGILNIIIR